MILSSKRRLPIESFFFTPRVRKKIIAEYLKDPPTKMVTDNYEKFIIKWKKIKQEKKRRMSKKKSIGFDSYTTMLDIIDLNKGFNCQSGPNCKHDKYRQAAEMLSYNDPKTNSKLFYTLFSDNFKLDCGMHNPQNRHVNNTYKNKYTIYKFYQKK